MFIAGIGTATPPQRFTQKECWDFAKQSPDIQRLSSRSQALLRKILLGDNGVEARHLVLSSLNEVFELKPDVLHRRFADNAPILAKDAAARALASAQTEIAQIDALVVSTCTGYLCPGLSSYVAEGLGIRSSALLLDLVGQGCGAALPNLRTAEALLTSGRAGRVLSICVEICSAAFYIDDDPGVLVSACLFGDGAAAAVLSTDRTPGSRSVRWCSAGTTLRPAERDLLRFEQKDGMLRNLLSPRVPDLAAEYAANVLNETLARAGKEKNEISGWVFHSGGKNVLSALARRLDLNEQDLRWSAAILNEYGNLSSPCVLFVLDAAIRGGCAGGLWWLASFGAGFSSHGALLSVD